MKKSIIATLLLCFAVVSFTLFACKENKPKQEPTTNNQKEDQKEEPDEVTYITFNGDVPLPPLVAFDKTSIEDIKVYCQKNNLDSPILWKSNDQEKIDVYYVKTKDKKIPIWLYSFIGEGDKKVLHEASSLVISESGVYEDDNGGTELLNKMVENSGFIIQKKLDYIANSNLYAYHKDKKVRLIVGPFIFDGFDGFLLMFNFSYSENIPEV